MNVANLCESRSCNPDYVLYRISGHLAKPTFVVSSNSLYLFRTGNCMKSARSHSQKQSADTPFNAS
jgi:hypothetical protein